MRLILIVLSYTLALSVSAQHQGKLDFRLVGNPILESLNKFCPKDYVAHSGWAVFSIDKDSAIESIEYYPNARYVNTDWLKRMLSQYKGKRVSGGFSFIWMPYTFGDTSWVDGSGNYEGKLEELPLGRFPSFPMGLKIDNNVFITRGLGWIQPPLPKR